MPSLYNIAAEFLALSVQLSELDLDPATVADTIEAESGALDQKLIACAMVARNFEVVADAKNAAASALGHQARSLHERADNLRAVIHRTMLACGRSKITDDPMLTLAIKGKAPAVKILDESLIPFEYWDQSPAPPPHPAKSRIGAAIKGGATVPGAQIEIGATRLEIA